MNVLFQTQTIAQLEQLLQGHVHTSLISLVVLLRKGGNSIPFFCVHPVSGDLFNYLQLTRHLDVEQPVYGIQAHGIADDQEPWTSVEAMAATYIQVLFEIQPEGPYRLGGHSIGGLIAFEMARQLETMGKDVEQLVLLDSSLASLQKVEQTRLTSLTETLVLTNLLDMLQAHFGDRPFESDEDFMQSSPEEQQRYVLDYLKIVRVLPQERDLVQFQKQLRVFQANAYSGQTYRPQGVYHGRAVLLYCHSTNHDPRTEWIPFMKGAWETQVVTGNHYSMLDEPVVHTVAEYIQHSLNQH